MTLSPERQRRLEELRKKYPKQEPQPPETLRYDACVEVTLRFEFRTHSQEEADQAAHHWLWNRGYEVTNLLYDRYAMEGLRNITLSQEVSRNKLSVDGNATHYEDGNGRFDLMTDEEVRTLYSDDLQSILVAFAEFGRRGELSPIEEERYHRLYELHTRYPEADFRLEIIPESP